MGGGGVETVKCDNFTLRNGGRCKKERTGEIDDRLFSNLRSVQQVKSGKLET